MQQSRFIDPASRPHVSFIFFLFIALSLLGALLVPKNSSAADAPLVLEKGWEYRWGDSPFDENGVPLWTVRQQDASAWQAIDFPSNPPGRDYQSNVWYRTTLPDGDWRDPVLYIYSIDLIAEVYFDGEKIYNYGTLDKNGQGTFEGWPWHMISLPPNFAGKEIYFRIYSSYSDIGLWGEVMLLERLDLFKNIFSNSMEKIIVSGISLLIGLMALIFALVQAERRTYLLISVFTLASAVMLFSQSQAKQFIFNAPLAWDLASASAYFTLPIVMALLFGTWCRGRYQPIIRVTWRVHAAFLVVAIGGSIAGVLELSSMYLVFDGLLTLSMLVLFAIAFSQFKNVSGLVRVSISAFAFFSLFLLIDMGVAHNFLPWTRMPISWGLLIFSIILIAISIRHFALTQKALKDLNLNLEQKVIDRTKELEYLASIDGLTKLTNRRAFYDEAERAFQSAKRYGRHLSILMLDIDHFKNFNDSFGHAVGDEVLIKVANCLKSICRDTDLPARFGGEEFIVLLEEAEKTAAFKTAERIRKAIEGINISQADQLVTVSIGVSPLHDDMENLDQLILQADELLYKAKKNGRNNTQMC